MAQNGKNETKDPASTDTQAPGTEPEPVRNGDPEAPEAADDGWFLPKDSREYLENLFKDLKEPVRLEVFTQEGINDPYNEAMTRFVTDLGKLSDKIRAEFFPIPSDQAATRQVERSPTLLIAPDTYRIRYTGSPLGEEARTFIESLMLCSVGQSGLSKVSKDVLAHLEEERTVRVFVNPECPYCPGQAAHAIKAAIERPGLVAAEIVETNENVDLAQQYKATALPLTVINDTLRERGLYPEERFAIELVTLREADELMAEQEGHDHDHAHHHHDHEDEDEVLVDLVVVGAGPAGLTAGIYAERSGLKTVIIEKGMIGGQVSLTPEVDNYPGFRNVGGVKLMEMMAEHARDYCTINEGEEIRELKVGKDIEVLSSRAHYRARAIILTTGAQSKFLGVPGEQHFYGRGVSVCASCDGWAYKGKDVVLVGGGDSALTEALYLHNIGVDVTVVHRRDAFRAQKHLQKSFEQAGIPVIWDSVVEEFLGEDGELNGVRIKNVKDGKTRDLAANAAFVAIGWKPNTELAEQLGVKLDQWGYIEVDRHMRTNIPRVYAAGDVTGGYQQIVTAVGSGAQAALSVFEDISNPYWKKSE